MLQVVGGAFTNFIPLRKSNKHFYKDVAYSLLLIILSHISIYILLKDFIYYEYSFDIFLTTTQDVSFKQVLAIYLIMQVLFLHGRSTQIPRCRPHKNTSQVHCCTLSGTYKSHHARLHNKKNLLLKLASSIHIV